MVKTTEFYSVLLKKKIKIPNTNVKEVIRNGRRFAVGVYKVGQKQYEAWRVLGMAVAKKTAPKKKGVVVKKLTGKNKKGKVVKKILGKKR